MSDLGAANTATTLDYESALDRVMGLADFERSTHSPSHSAFHLERMGLLLERLGNIHLETPTVHVAGTKGKGSTAAMVTAILVAEGHRTGLYTSPHLHSAVERIRVGLEPVSRWEFASLAERAWPAIEEVGRSGPYGPITTFEMLTAMAFLHFKGVGADVQVLEVGLGGRLDSTNVAQPRVCAITSISLDHVKTLGNSLALIAYEKAGIIKQGVPVVVAPQPEEAMEVIDRVARDRGAPLIEVEERMSWRKHRGGTDGQSFHVSGLRDSYDLWTPLAGDHQLENAAVAVATVETLAEAGTPVAKESIARGMEAVSWPGRLEIVSEGRPPVMVDGAHNPHSMRRLTAAVEDYFQFKRLFVIFGALGGHSAMGMISELASLAPRMLAVSSRHPRAASSEMLAEAVVTQGLELVFQSGDIGAATRRALEMADEDDLVLGTGSLSVAAEIIEEVRGIEPELYPSIKPPSRAGRSKV